MLRKLALLAAIASSLSLTACSNSGSEASPLVIYSGRSEEYIAPFFEEFTKETGIKLDIRYGDSAALAAQILEEGENSPADVFISQDAGALGAVASAELFTVLDKKLLARVGTNFRSATGDWVGITGRVRVFAYSPDRVTSLPATVDDLIKSEWRGRLGIAPTNASFQAFVTAMIQTRGEAKTEAWLRGIVANSPKYFEKNSLIVQAIDSGEIDAGLVNHYYIWEVSEELGRDVRAAITFFAPNDVGNLINVSGVGIFKSSTEKENAAKLVDFLLTDKTQKGFVAETHEYSLVLPDQKPDDLPALSEIKAPKVNLAELADLKRTQRLLIKVGLL